MKKVLYSIAILAIVALTCVSCIRAPNYDGVVQIQTNEIAFLVNMTDDAAATQRETMIQRKDISIPGYFVRTGRFQHQGYWRPTVKVITVSQAPVRREWVQQNKIESIAVESDKSVGFTVPLILNAYIANAADAQKYLSSFRPISDDNLDWSKLVQREWGTYAKENAQPLEKALDTVVNTRISQELAQLFIKIPILYAAQSSKVFIDGLFNGMLAADLNKEIYSITGDRSIVFSKDIPNLVEWAKESYGITITAMSPGDGLLYDSPDIQSQIDNNAIAAMRERTLQQEQANARAEQIVRQTQAQTASIEANQRAAQISTLARMQEIENSKIIAEATARAIEAGKVVPAGSYPTGLTSLIITPHYNSLGPR